MVAKTLPADRTFVLLFRQPFFHAMDALLHSDINNAATSLHQLQSNLKQISLPHYTTPASLILPSYDFEFSSVSIRDTHWALTFLISSSSVKTQKIVMWLVCISCHFSMNVWNCEFKILLLHWSNFADNQFVAGHAFCFSQHWNAWFGCKRDEETLYHLHHIRCFIYDEFHTQ